MPRGQKNKKVKARAVRKSHLKQKREQPKDGDVAMGGAKEKGPKESAHKLKKRQAGERKKMKAELKEMKRQRKALPKKGQKDAKKALSQKIRDLLEDVTERHKAELEAAGLDKEAGLDADDSEDDDEDEDI
uniref:Uncharacterized protein n=1 Tax=Alexandrium catenella TaxID=2925 RepID=A0A7S1QZK2_ALECA